MISLGSGTGGDLGEQYVTTWSTSKFAAARSAILADPSLASAVSRARRR